MIPSLRHILRDTSGASIVIALVFFLICAIIGSIVVTAASVNAKAVETQRSMQQAEFTVGSAAQTMASELASAQVFIVNAPAENEIPTIDENNLTGQEFARTFWSMYGNEILEARSTHTSFSSTSMRVDQDSVGTVYGRLTVDQDLNITVDLSRDEAFATDSPYNMTVSVQCIPSYDASGKLLSFSYEQAVIQRVGGAL